MYTFISLYYYYYYYYCYYQDELWFGVAGVEVSVSDMGNRGWVVDSYEDTHHRSTVSEVLSLRGGAVSLIPEHQLGFQRVHGDDFTWEVYAKRLSHAHLHTTARNEPTWAVGQLPPKFEPVQAPGEMGHLPDFRVQCDPLPMDPEVNRSNGSANASNESEAAATTTTTNTTTSTTTTTGTNTTTTTSTNTTTTTTTNTTTTSTMNATTTTTTHTTTTTTMTNTTTTTTTSTNTTTTTTTNTTTATTTRSANDTSGNESINTSGNESNESNESESTTCDADVMGPPFTLAISPDGYVEVRFRAECGYEVGGRSRALLREDEWHHLAVAVRHNSRVPLDRQAAEGRVDLYVDGVLDSSWPLRRSRMDFVPRRAMARVVVQECDDDRAPQRVSLSRARLWARALEPGEMGLCEDARSPPVEEGCTGAACETLPGVVPALSFSLEGVLDELDRRASIQLSGTWSFEIDSPPRCLDKKLSPFDKIFDHCACYDETLNDAQVELLYVWHSPQAHNDVTAGMRAYANDKVFATEGRYLSVSTLIGVHRYFVNESPTLRMLEPYDGLLRVFEDHPSHVGFVVTHKAARQLVGRPLLVVLRVEHGYVRSITGSEVSGLSEDRRQIHYRAPLLELNNFIAQVEYVPDPNYNGGDEMFVSVTDREFTVNVTVPIEIAPLTDLLTLICPPVVDLAEGVRSALIATNVTIHDRELLPGERDESTEVAVEMTVSGGGLHLSDRVTLGDRVHLANLSNLPDGPAMGNPASAALIPVVRFTATLRDLRAVLRALAFTSYPELFNGVVHFGLHATVVNTGIEAAPHPSACISSSRKA